MALELPYSKLTLLDKFLFVARNNPTANNLVLECGSDRWTYGDLDTISTALAIELHEQFGSRITVASINENHPYILAILLATWKIGGIFAPLDPHAPPEMLAKMLETVNPTYVVIPEGNNPLRLLTDRLKLRAHIFSVARDTVPHLLQKFMHHAPQDSDAIYGLPSPESLALYLHTSSATSISNLKCIPVSHGILAQGTVSRLRWYHKSWPETQFEKLRVMGWTTWAHIMGISHDLGSTFATGGCYVFGVLPSGYPTQRKHKTSSTKKGTNAVADLMEGLLRTQPDVLIGVPWLLEGFRAVYMEESLLEGSKLLQTLTRLKYFCLGGAQTAIETLTWATNHGIKIVLDLGMTELGRPLFHLKATDTDVGTGGWSLEDCLIDDVELALIDDAGENVMNEGELVITSRNINTSYLNYDNTTFSQSEDGKTTFQTGDIYARTAESKYLWKGRKEDYIQMVTSETLDPRPIEQTLRECPRIADCCVVGNNFLNKPSEFICAIIQPSQPLNTLLAWTPECSTAASTNQDALAEITRVIASVNRTLLPPLRITWSRVLILDEDKQIPHTKKGDVFRKKLEDVFGVLLKSHMSTKLKDGLSETRAVPANKDKMLEKDAAEKIIIVCVADVLQINAETLGLNAELSFAELGMDSNMAVQIVNRLNTAFSLNLPPNACHTFVDLTKLQQAVLSELGIINVLTNSRPSSNFDTKLQDNTVVIVGQAFRLPGNINTPESFWHALVNKRDDIITDVPLDRWDHKSFYCSPSSTAQPQPGDISFEKAGFINVAHYDNAFFGISAPEAMYVGPTIRLTLETAFEALENACIPVSKVKGTKMGIFVGTAIDVGYHQLLYAEKGFGTYSRFYGTGMAASTACGRLSYLLDVHGPSTSIDTACSSGLVAFDQGVKYLQSGKGESALVSAVNTNIWPGSFAFLSAQNMTSPRSRCATFTDEADGYVPSEGCVTLILKTKMAALRDGDNILAIVKSSDTTHGGKSQGLVAPNVHAQIELQRQLLDQAHLNPSDIDFLEAHGTGTSLGDLIEIQGINEVFRGSHPESPLIIGAAKSCIGHTEFAAGLVGVLKAISQFKHASVPGLMHLVERNLNPSIDRSIVPIHIPHENIPLPPKNDRTPYRGLVLANGFAGSIAGVILEDPKLLSEPQKLPVPDTSLTAMLFVVSAKSVEGLQEYIGHYLKFCRAAPPSDFKNICYTSCVGREHYQYRFACAVSDKDELIAALEQRLRIGVIRYNDAPTRSVVFAFPGQGSQYHGMASSLSNHFPEFKRIVTLAATSAAQLSGYPILSLLMETSASNSNTLAQSAPICIYVYQYSVATWIKRLGILPIGVLGHSLGEIAAAVVAGAMTYELGLELVVQRTKILRSDPSEPGGMAIVSAPKDSITELIHQLHLDNQVVIAVYNSRQSHVISGYLSAVEAFVASAKIMELRVTKLNVTQAFHSPLIKSSLSSLEKWSERHQSRFSNLKIRMYSTVNGITLRPGMPLPPQYWTEHARDPVRFSDAIETVILDEAVDMILDIGPQPFIWTSLQDVSHTKHSIATSTKPSQDQFRTFLRALAFLFEKGLAPDTGRLFSEWNINISKTTIPSYPFQRRRYFPSSIPSRNGIVTNSTTVTSTKSDKKAARQFVIGASFYELLSDHRIEGCRIVPGAALVDFFVQQLPFKTLQSITFHAPMVVESPDTPSVSQFDETSGTFSLDPVDGAALGLHQAICSGTAALEAPLATSQKDIDASITCLTKRNKASIYASYTNVQFGPAFRNIEELCIWETHADSFIIVPSTNNPQNDRVRKLDCCLHGIGAVVEKQVPQTRELNGAFLPASLEHFTLHRDELPESFICRYHLPMQVERNFHVISAAFEVLSHSGDLLISCAKYSLAWIPHGSAVQHKHVSDEGSQPYWLYQSWIPRSIPGQLQPSVSPLTKCDQMLYVGRQGSTLSDLMVRYAHNVHVIYMPAINEQSFYNVTTSIQSIFNEISSISLSATLSLILDITSNNGPYPSRESEQYHHHVLDLFKLLVDTKIIISNVTLISVFAIPLSSHAASVDYNATLTNVPSSASLVHGMLRVFRRETGLDTQTWALDLPHLDNATTHKILSHELLGRQKGVLSDRVVAYRHTEDTTLRRMVPVLMPMVDPSPGISEKRFCAGTTVIVGMGSIGCALASFLISQHGNKVIFIGRRGSDDENVKTSLATLHAESYDRCFYVQADVNKLDSLRNAILNIRTTHGDIEHIIHTAVVMRDATIQKLDVASFDEVLEPKVTGSWNLHTITQELCSTLKSFVLLSSISVSLGNPGQIAYVAGNYYMEALAAYRRQQDLPAVCIQLGAWESRLVENVQNMHDPQDLVQITSNKYGIPNLLRAIKSPPVVQLVANLNMNTMDRVPGYSLDPFFKEILPRELENEPQTKEWSINPWDETQAILRNVLELRPSETLEITNTMTACGVDSISFAQIRGRVMHQLRVDVPMKFLSDTFTIHEMLTHIVEQYAILHRQSRK